MKVDDLIVLGKKKVHSSYAKMLLADLLNKNALELDFCLHEVVSDEIKNEYLEKLKLLEEGRSLQYVIGNVSFCGICLFVDERVLIPRFETEELVENTYRYILDYFCERDISILDLGCGSGAIGLALKSKLKEASVTLVDISDDALDVAKKNASNLDLDVTFVKSDMLDNVVGGFDVIISNPPYIRENEEIEDIVKNNEPHLALYGGKDGLDCYRKILANCKNHLNKKFMLGFEIGYLQKDQIVDLIRKYLGDVEIVCKKDLSDKDRMIFVFGE